MIPLKCLPQLRLPHEPGGLLSSVHGEGVWDEVDQGEVNAGRLVPRSTRRAEDIQPERERHLRIRMASPHISAHITENRHGKPAGHVRRSLHAFRSHGTCRWVRAAEPFYGRQAPHTDWI